MKYSTFMKLAKENKVEQVKKALSTGKMTNKNYNVITAKNCVQSEASAVLEELVKVSDFGLEGMDNEALRVAASKDIKYVILLLKSADIRNSLTIEWANNNLKEDCAKEVVAVINKTRKLSNF